MDEYLTEMTRQLNDQCRFEEDMWSIIDHDGPALFSPEDQGLNPVAPHSACWRGWVGQYDVRDRLFLRHLWLGAGAVAMRPGLKLPVLLGVAGVPQMDRLRSRAPMIRAWTFDLAVGMRWTGRLLLARTFQPQLDPGGLAPHWLFFQDARELSLCEGRLVSSRDCSSTLAALRTMAADPPQVHDDYVRQHLTGSYRRLLMEPPPVAAVRWPKPDRQRKPTKRLKRRKRSR